MMDENGSIEYANSHFEHTTGYSSDEIKGKPFGFNVLDENDEKPSSLWHSISNSQPDWKGEICSLYKNGMAFWESINVSPLQDENSGAVRYVSIQEDITARRFYEENLRQQANYDELTGLSNRNLMLEKLDNAVIDCLNNHTELALICIDLDHFKHVNEILGHITGDELLMRVASRLASCVGKEHILARVGGDEFVILIPRIKNYQ